MALNLNKENDDAKSASTKSRFDLAKEPVAGSGDSNKVSTNDLAQAKKSPILTFLAISVLVGGAVFWFISNSESGNTSSAQNENKTVSDGIAQENVQATNSGDSSVETNSVEGGAAVNVDEPVNMAEESSTNNTSQTGSVETNGINDGVNGQNQDRVLQPGNSSLPVGTLEEKAQSVIRGRFGVGAERKSALGVEYQAVQSRVNEILGSQRIN
jgi:hypothetical protein